MRGGGDEGGTEETPAGGGQSHGSRCEALRDEENLPAEQSKEGKDSRVPYSDADGRWPPRAPAPAGKGPEASGSLTLDRSESFPPGARLLKRREYQAAYQRGVRVPGSLLVLFVLESTHGFARLGITATRKVGCAVVRNRARRRVREIFRRNRREVPSWDLVVNIRAKAVNAPYALIEKDLIAQLRRAKRRIAQRRSRDGS